MGKVEDGLVPIALSLHILMTLVHDVDELQRFPHQGGIHRAREHSGDGRASACETGMAVERSREES
jgi:hypothetical protein